MNMLELAQNNLDTAKSNLVYRLKNPINLPDDWFYIMEGEEDISKWRNIVRRIREGEEEEMVVLASGEVTTCCVDLNGKKGEE